MTRILLVLMSLMLIASTVSARDDDDDKKPKIAKTNAKADSKPEAEPPGVTLNAQQIKDLGIATVAVEATALPPQVQGFAVVLDPQPLIQAAGDLSAAMAADSASRRQSERLDALYREDATVSGKDADAGRAQAAADRAKLTGLSATARTTWGNLVTSGEGAKLVGELASGAVAIARVEFPAAVHASGRHMTLSAAGGGRSVKAEILQAAPGANQLADGEGYLVRLSPQDGAAWLRPGLRMSASADASGAASEHVLVPRDAIIIHDGAMWCYVAEDAGHFSRERITPVGGRAGDTLPVDGIEAGDKVVARGAALLLAAEQRALLSSGGAD